MGSLKTFKTLIKENKAPRGAKYIGIFKKDGSNSELVKKIDISHTNLENTETDEPLYSFGVLSDIHMRSNNVTGFASEERRSEAQYDFDNAVNFFQNNGANFICACGDLGVDSYSSGYTDSEECNTDWEMVYKKLSRTTVDSQYDVFPVRTIPFFTAMGNHDTINTAYKGGSFNKEKVKTWINEYWYNYTFKSNADRINESITDKITFQAWTDKDNTGLTTPDVEV